MERLQDLVNDFTKRSGEAADEATRQRGTVQERYLHGKTEAYNDAAAKLQTQIDTMRAEFAAAAAAAETAVANRQQQPSTEPETGKAVWGESANTSEATPDGDNIVWGTSTPTPGTGEGQQDQAPLDATNAVDPDYGL